MKRSTNLFAALLLATALLATSQPAQAWEPATTHAGLTEESARAAKLHHRLQRQFGAQLGLYASLAVPEGDARALFQILRRLNPTHGYVPNAKGEMSALAWLVAGSVVADVPGSQANNHYFDPRSGKSLTTTTEGSAARRLGRVVTGLNKHAQIREGGESASAWWRSINNTMGYAGFADQFRKAVASGSAAERERHLAGSLLAAGSMLHVLQDMGSPGHVRDDLAANQEQVSTQFRDRGSRFERVAALAFGRLGIPTAKQAPVLATLQAHFGNAEATGLANVIESSYFSSGTLPDHFKVKRNTGSSAFKEALQAKLQRPLPAPHSRLDVVAARNKDGATWSNAEGVCLTRYHVKQAVVSFAIDDSCALEQLEAILPVIAGYGDSFLQALYPADLELAKSDGKLRVGFPEHQEGTLRMFADLADGTRTEYHHLDTKGSSATLPFPPAGTQQIAVLLERLGEDGMPSLSTLSSTWPLPN